MDDGESACAVCEQRLGKARFHYGGVSCYSCRAFFRRNTQRDELPLCKAESRCVITAAVRKQCAACRYEKCLKVGMRPDLVLDDDEKKTRFRKFLSKKQEEQEQNESRVVSRERNDSLSPSYENENPRTPAHDRPEFHSQISHSEQAMRMHGSSLIHNPSVYNTRISPPLIHNSDVTKVVAAKSTSYLYDSPITEVKTEMNIIQNCTTSYSQNNMDNYNYLYKKNSFHPFQMYHEKKQQHPLMTSQKQNWAKFPQYLKTNQNHPNQPDPFYGNQVSYQPHNQQLTYAKDMRLCPKKDHNNYAYTNPIQNDKNAISPVTNNTKGEALHMNLSQPMEALNQFTKSISSEIPSTSSKTYQTDLKLKEELEKYDAHGLPSDIRRWFQQFNGDELIQRYVNKKYGNKVFSFGYQSNILEKLSSNSQDCQDSLLNVLNHGKRKSVIVRAALNKYGECEDEDENEKHVEGETEKLNECYMSDVINNALSLIPDASEMLKSFNFDIMQDLYTNEEHCHVEQIVAVWQDKWDEINFGQDVVGIYINFCQNRREFPSEFFELVNLQIRERCLSFVCSLNEIDQISAEDQIDLFRRNLDNAEMMAYVHGFNQKTWAEEINFLFGKNDKIQWKNRDANISGLPLSTMVTHMPLSEVEKLELYKNLMSCVTSIIKDRTVFILMWLIIIFSQDEGDQNTAPLRIKNTFVTMLMRYLLQKRGTNIDSDMNMVYNCIGALPRIAKSFSRMKDSTKC